MVVCRFFLHGMCKFGSACRFEHDINDNHQQSVSILRQNQQAANTANTDTETLLNSVKNDMLAAEKGGQWLLSSYAPFKEKPQFPGFEDQSFEEMRLLYYEAMKNGSAEQCAQKVETMLQDALMRMRVLQQPNATIINLLKDIYNTPVQQQQQPATTSTFGNTMPQQQQQQQQSIFGSSNPPQQQMFAMNQNQNVFVQPQQQNQNQNVFVQPPQPNIFGGGAVNVQQQSNQQNVFTNNQFAGQTAATNQIFATPQMSNSPFNQTSFASPLQANQPSFASPLQANQQSFASPMQANQQSFASPMQANQQPPAAFVQQPQTQFGGQQNNVNVNEEFYSKIEELTPDELNAYQSNSFEMGKIPEKPPPYNFCT